MLEPHIFFKANVPFLSGLTDADASALAAEAKEVHFQPGAAIIRQGITVDGLHVIVSGKVQVTIKPKGKNPVDVAQLGPGDVFGERSILEFGVAGATIKAIDEVRLLLVPQETFLRLMEGNQPLKELFMSKIEDRRKPLKSNPTIQPPPEPPKAG